MSPVLLAGSNVHNLWVPFLCLPVDEKSVKSCFICAPCRFQLASVVRQLGLCNLLAPFLYMQLDEISKKAVSPVLPAGSNVHKWG